MTLNKQKMVREISKRTRLTNGDVQQVIETLVQLWTEALVEGERIEIENFLVLQPKSRGRIHPQTKVRYAVTTISATVSKQLRRVLNHSPGH